MTRMPFGKFRGWTVAELPDDYLTWLMGLDDLREPLASAIRREADHRRTARQWEREATARLTRCPSPQLADELIGIGLRTLTTRRHPDAPGGSHDAMIELTATVDWLRSVVRRGLAA